MLQKRQVGLLIDLLDDRVEVPDRLMRVNDQNEMNLCQELTPPVGDVTADCGLIMPRLPERQLAAVEMQCAPGASGFGIMPGLARESQTGPESEVETQTVFAR